ncbi:glycosyltransferase family 2 protein, partial [Photobacterium kishitanii]|uniref:glycosyltransferase family 2 protein n=1 Tax=Photobacterium kishitanii TaxID=318456 RepID=UPI000D4016E5
MKYSPVIIGTYSRIEHLKRCVESLKKNRLAKKTILIIGIDHPIKDSHKLDNDSIKEYCKDIIGFEKVIIKEWDCNLGARKNFAKLRDIAFEFSETVIITEDDNVFHPGFLEYMNTNLSNYEDDNRIFAICGYNYPITYSEEDGNEIDQLVLKSYSAWGVGVWKNKYKQVDFSSQAYVDILKSPLKIYD